MSSCTVESSIREFEKVNKGKRSFNLPPVSAERVLVNDFSHTLMQHSLFANRDVAVFKFHL